MVMARGPNYKNVPSIMRAPLLVVLLLRPVFDCAAAAPARPAAIKEHGDGAPNYIICFERRLTCMIVVVLIKVSLVLSVNRFIVGYESRYPTGLGASWARCRHLFNVRAISLAA